MKITGQQAIADLFGVSRESIDNWQREGMPVEARGGPGVSSVYDSEKCIAWRVKAEVIKARGDRPQNRLARVQADKIEMENLERRRQLIPADQLEPRLQAAFAMARAAWSATAPRLAREMPADPDERERLLQAEFEAFLHRLADWGKAGDVDDDDA
ncbi:MAG: terminase small subunit [Sulfuritalea sp.]|nr:terminase small subunit [Sulfuritalea sp.]